MSGMAESLRQVSVILSVPESPLPPPARWDRSVSPQSAQGKEWGRRGSLRKQRIGGVGIAGRVPIGFSPAATAQNSESRKAARDSESAFPQHRAPGSPAPREQSPGQEPGGHSPRTVRPLGACFHVGAHQN